MRKPIIEHVNLTVTDKCGDWPSFVGAGTGL